MKRALFFVAAATFTIAAIACGTDKPPATPPTPPPPPATTNAPKAAQPSTAPAFDGAKVVRKACLSCHAEDMLAQQRLTAAQWTKVVTKMKGWGAGLQDADVAPLSAWLAERYGTDAGAWQAPVIAPAVLSAELEKTSDGPFANGDVTKGKAMYERKCIGCHAADGRGDIGILLVDRPFVWRAADFADVIRKGKGGMPAMSLSDTEIADTLAYVRSLKNPLP